MALRKRYQPRLVGDTDGEWEVYDTLRNNGCFRGGFDEAEAIEACAQFNKVKPDLEDGQLTPVTANSGLLEHYRGVVEKEITNAADKCALAENLGDYIQYASDRLSEERLIHIQLWWEAVQRANGYEPVAALPTKEG